VKSLPYVTIETTVVRRHHRTGQEVDVRVTLGGAYDPADREVGMRPGFEEVTAVRLYGQELDLTPAEMDRAVEMLAEALE